MIKGYSHNQITTHGFLYQTNDITFEQEEFDDKWFKQYSLDYPKHFFYNFL
jgi:hypothetical protein